MTVEPVAAGAFSAAVSSTGRLRPTYARSCIGALAERVRSMGPDACVLDVGARTGILAGQLRRARLRCVGVEPVRAMGTQLRRSLPDVPVAQAGAAHLPLRSGSVHLVTLADAELGALDGGVLAELARVCVRGGALALLWGVREPPTGWGELVASSGLFRVERRESFPDPAPATVHDVSAQQSATELLLCERV